MLSRHKAEAKMAVAWAFFSFLLCQDILAGLESELPEIMRNMLGTQVLSQRVRSSSS